MEEFSLGWGPVVVEEEEEEDVGGRDFLLEEDGLLKIWTFWWLICFF